MSTITYTPVAGKLTEEGERDYDVIGPEFSTATEATQYVINEKLYLRVFWEIEVNQ